MGRKMKHNANEDLIVRLYDEGLSGVKIAEKLNIKTYQVYYILEKTKTKRRSNKVNSRIYTADYSYFEEIDTQEKAYWLGFIAADGYLVSDRNQVGITLSTLDKSHLEKFKLAISSDYPINDYVHDTTYKKDTAYSRIVITSEKMKSDLISHGILENKTLDLDFPKLSKDLEMHFIRGYFDGDGSISKTLSRSKLLNEYQIKITGTKALLQGILNSFKIPNAKLFERYYDGKDNYYTSIAGNVQVERLLDVMYKDSIIHLDRKYLRYLELKTQSSSGVIPEKITL